MHTKYKNFVSCGLREEDFLHISHYNPMAVNDAPGRDPYGLQGYDWQDNYILLHTKYESFGPCGFGEERLFSNCKSMRAMCCHRNQSSDPTWPKT